MRIAASGPTAVVGPAPRKFGGRSLPHPGVVGALMLVVLAAIVGVGFATFSSLDRSFAYTRTIDVARARSVEALNAMMDADQFVNRYALDRDPAERAHYVEATARFERNLASTRDLLRMPETAAAARALDAFEERYRFWRAHYGDPAMAPHTTLDARAVVRGGAVVDTAQDRMIALQAELSAAVALRGAQTRTLLVEAYVGATAALTVLTIVALILEARRIRERARGVAALQERADALARSNAALQDFAYVASHDLQEPLRMISSYTQLLGRRYRGRLDADADEFIAFAIDGAKRMQTLIGDILAYSRVTSSEAPLAVVDTQSTLAAALENLDTAIAESGAAIVGTALPPVLGDRAQLVQLLQNLIGNAIKYRGTEPVAIRVWAERRGDFWNFAVRDNGIGIDPEYRERIFRMFQRLHGRSEYSGTGIGLAICKRIVERHGGDISVEASPGGGSTFLFTLRAA